jgi:hypothetical protein
MILASLAWTGWWPVKILLALSLIALAWSWRRWTEVLHGPASSWSGWWGPLALGHGFAMGYLGFVLAVPMLLLASAWFWPRRQQPTARATILATLILLGLYLAHLLMAVVFASLLLAAGARAWRKRLALVATPTALLVLFDAARVADWAPRAYPSIGSRLAHVLIGQLPFMGYPGTAHWASPLNAAVLAALACWCWLRLRRPRPIQHELRPVAGAGLLLMFAALLQPASYGPLLVWPGVRLFGLGLMFVIVALPPPQRLSRLAPTGLCLAQALLLVLATLNSSGAGKVAGVRARPTLAWPVESELHLGAWEALRHGRPYPRLFPTGMIRPRAAGRPSRPAGGITRPTNTDLR